MAVRFSMKEGDVEVAHAWLYLIHNDLHEEPFGLLEDLCVDEAHRGKGITSKLLTEIIAQAKKLRCYKLIATSRIEHEEVHKLYLGNGFTKWGHVLRLEL